MKDKNPKDHHQSHQLSLKTSSENLILNVIIIMLFAVIIFMGYSLYKKFDTAKKAEALVEVNKNKSGSIQVEILNGCGVEGVADNLTDYLRKNNFDVVQMGNYISYEVEKSIVIDRSGKIFNAYKVADVLGISRKNVIQQINSNYFLDASIVIGKDFNNLKPYQNQ